MDSKELMSQAARLSAGRRRRVKTACALCQRPIEGTVRRRYCCAACKLRAARKRAEDSEMERDARRIAAEKDWPIEVARMEVLANKIAKGRVFEDSTPLIRESRDPDFR